MAKRAERPRLLMICLDVHAEYLKEIALDVGLTGKRSSREFPTVHDTGISRCSARCAVGYAGKEDDEQRCRCLLRSEPGKTGRREERRSREYPGTEEM